MVTRRKPRLPDLFEALQDGLRADLQGNRKVLVHPTRKGDATELRWRSMLVDHLPSRYDGARATIVDAEGQLSDEIDLVIFDRQYTPKLFNRDGALYLPSESVYAVIEIKQDLTKENIEYASQKIASVRRLRRTSVKIRHAGGKYRPVRPARIVGAVVALVSGWRPAFGPPFQTSLARLPDVGRIDLGCALSDGAFLFDKKRLLVSEPNHALVSFFVSLFGRLQQVGTVPALDLAAYASHAFEASSAKKPR
jgi:hypothetical protein